MLGTQHAGKIRSRLLNIERRDDMARGLEKAAAILGFAAGTVFFLKEMGFLKFKSEKTEDGKSTFTVEFDTERVRKELNKAVGEPKEEEEDFYDGMDAEDEDEISKDIEAALRDLDPEGDGKF